MSRVAALLTRIRPEFDFSQSQDFFEDGVLDSFDLVTLVTELDQAYGISIDGLDIVPENFHSVEQIEALISRYGVTP